MLFLLLVVALMVGAAADSGSPEGPDPVHVELVKRRLIPLQTLSFATDREYCGYLLSDLDGKLSFTDMVRGGHDGCTPQRPLIGPAVIASVHTHGAYNPSVPAEFPTTLDMESDRREGVSGYVATPGGRLWYIDSRRMVTYQLCGAGCLPQDPNFQEGDDGVIGQSYEYRQLLALEGGKP